MAAHLEKELQHLERKLLAMAGHAQSAAQRATAALLHGDSGLATKVIQEDDILDRFEIDVDELSIQLLAKGGAASDLLFITVAMKICHDLERVGDEATTISRRTVALSREPSLQLDTGIPQMSDVVLHMLSEAMESFVQRRPGQARSVIARDKEVDGLNKKVRGELTKHMAVTPGAIRQCLDLMVISKSLERIADHATNIAEEVVHLCEGVDVRFDPRTKRPKAAPRS